MVSHSRVAGEGRATTVAPPPAAVPWYPECVRHVAANGDRLRASWDYVVLEEIIGSTALLQRWRWPLADQAGRLFWPRKESEHPSAVTVRLPLLQHQLYGPNGLQRHPRPGDTFAAPRRERGSWGRRGHVHDLRTLFPTEIYDISAVTHEAARLAHHGAVASLSAAEGADPVTLQLVDEEAARRTRTRAPTLRLSPPPETPARQARRTR